MDVEDDIPWLLVGICCRKRQKKSRLLICLVTWDDVCNPHLFRRVKGRVSRLQVLVKKLTTLSSPVFWTCGKTTQTLTAHPLLIAHTTKPLRRNHFNFMRPVQACMTLAHFIRVHVRAWTVNRWPKEVWPKGVDMVALFRLRLVGGLRLGRADSRGNLHCSKAIEFSRPAPSFQCVNSLSRARHQLFTYTR
jgi:hypothetical protein